MWLTDDEYQPLTSQRLAVWPGHWQAGIEFVVCSGLSLALDVLLRLYDADRVV